MSYADDLGHCDPPDFGDPIWDTMDHDELWGKTCNRCNKGSLKWQNLNEVRGVNLDDDPIWRLFEKNGTMHKCYSKGVNVERGYLYTAWGSENAEQANTLVEGSGPPRYANGEPMPDATKKFFEFNATNWDHANSIYYEKQGWGTYTPFVYDEREVENYY